MSAYVFVFFVLIYTYNQEYSLSFFSKQKKRSKSPSIIFIDVVDYHQIMTDTISSVEETVVNGDIVTKVTETKTVNKNFFFDKILFYFL